VLARPPSVVLASAPWAVEPQAVIAAGDASRVVSVRSQLAPCALVSTSRSGRAPSLAGDSDALVVQGAFGRCARGTR